jgi:hypothetical protein
MTSSVIQDDETAVKDSKVPNGAVGNGKLHQQQTIQTRSMASFLIEVDD